MPDFEYVKFYGMEKGKQNNFLSKFLAGILPVDENTQIVYEPSKNFLLQSLLKDNEGNQNVFRIIVDKDAPGLQQRIITNDYRNYN